MKLLSSAFLVCLYLSELIGQARQDFIWVLGYDPNKPESYLGGTLLDFNRDLVSPQYFHIGYDAQVPGILSTPSGKLLIYTNGCTIIGSDHMPIQGGDTISYGYVWDNYCGKDLGYPGTQNNLILPFPGDTNRAFVFYKYTTEDYNHNILFYADVSFSEDYPLGIVTSKDKLLVDPGSSALITATRHANGRDWWLILPDNATNRFYIMLLDPSGVMVVDTQAIGQPWEEREWASQAVFTPDGSKYIRCNPFKGLDIFDFDRCTGQLSNPIESGPLSDPIIVGCGAGVSTDSRFLYISNIKFLYQYDLTQPDILNTRILIDSFDGYINPFPTTFYQMTLGPDGKLYMFSTNGVKSIHVIHNPEQWGQACGFEQHGIELPSYAKIGSPNIPYYRSGPLIGSTCDTLGISKSPVADFRYEIDSLSPFLLRFKDLSYYNPDSWTWDFGDGLVIDNRKPPDIDFGQSGLYPVCLTVANDYGEHTFCRTIRLQDTMTSIGVMDQLSAAHIYPNPVDDKLYLDIPSHTGRSTITFHSAIGLMISELELTGGIQQIDVSTWMSGVYFYVVKINDVISYTGMVMKY